MSGFGFGKGPPLTAEHQAVHEIRADETLALRARIAELTAALKLLLAAIDEKSDDERETLAEFEKFAAVVRAARAAYKGEKND